MLGKMLIGNSRGHNYHHTSGVRSQRYSCGSQIFNPLDSERGNFKLFAHIYWLYLRKIELFGARLLKKRDPNHPIGPKQLANL